MKSACLAFRFADLPNQRTLQCDLQLTRSTSFLCTLCYNCLFCCCLASQFDCDVDNSSVRAAFVRPQRTHFNLTLFSPVYSASARFSSLLALFSSANRNKFLLPYLCVYLACAHTFGDVSESRHFPSTHRLSTFLFTTIRCTRF